ncbi:hypothetical protein CN689_21605 [Peribacillus butanolivorans]|uniref:HNH nuclease domain-containing protein n=2 Tax=Peribacillus butanolivorans TaxID=421767 RepID=A0AAX0RYW8_9BACI|nr:hypothetical protein CN689_21605 [Peribacillus butanolivorans]
MVNTDGVVLSKTNGKILTHHINTGGYPFVCLRINCKPKQLLVHRLVAIAFIPNPDNKPIVNHIDSDRRNPKKSNLGWVTHKENSEHMVNSFNCPDQDMTILLDKMGDEICVFPSRNRCIKYVYKQFRIKYGYDEDENISDVDIEAYTELSPVSRDREWARRVKLNF